MDYLFNNQEYLRSIGSTIWYLADPWASLKAKYQNTNKQKEMSNILVNNTLPSFMPINNVQPVAYQVPSMVKATPTNQTFIYDKGTQDTVNAFQQLVQQEQIKKAQNQVAISNVQVIPEEHIEPHLANENYIIEDDDDDDDIDEEFEIIEQNNADSIAHQHMYEAAVDRYAHLIYSYADNKDVYKLFPNIAKKNKNKLSTAFKETVIKTVSHFMFNYGMTVNDGNTSISFPLDIDIDHFNDMKNIVMRLSKIPDTSPQQEQFEMIKKAKESLKGVYKENSLVKEFWHIWDQYATKKLSSYNYKNMKPGNKGELFNIFNEIIL